MCKSLIVPKDDFIAKPINGIYELSKYKEEAKKITEIISEMMKMPVSIESIFSVWFCYSMECYNIEWKSVENFTSDEIAHALVAFTEHDVEYGMPSEKKVLKYPKETLEKMISDRLEGEDLNIVSKSFGIDIDTLKQIFDNPVIFSFDMYFATEKLLNLSIEELTSFEVISIPRNRNFKINI